MDMTAFRLTPARPELLADTPAVFQPRRFSDPVSELNCELYDQTRLLAAAVEAVDRMGLSIMSVSADLGRNKRILVRHTRECDALDGVEVARQNGWSHWEANRFGVNICWCVQMEAA